MIQDGGQIRGQGSQDFWGHYEAACALQQSLPLSAVKQNLEKQMLGFNGDRLKVPDWKPVLGSISINEHLQRIAISSNYQASVCLGEGERTHHRSTIKRKIPAVHSKELTFKLCKALRDCLTVSSKLKTLQLNGLPLRARDLIILAKGLEKSTSLETFSLANCPIMDEGLEVIYKSVKYSTSIKSVDLSGCSLSWRGAEHMAKIIQHQGRQRHGTAWVESLRYRQPQFESMVGLRRVTLNYNSLIGDRGAASLARELAEDLWVKAVDLQGCDLSNEGAHCLLEMLKTNSSLCVLDIRNNPLVDKKLSKTIIERVLMNPGGQSSEYCWIKPASPEPQRACGPKRKPLLRATRDKSASNKVSHKGSSLKGQSSAVVHTHRNHHRSSGVPWRTAARAERQRALPPGVTVSAKTHQGGASVKITIESESEREEDDENEEVVVEVNPGLSSVSVHDTVSRRRFERVQMELKECRLMLAEERGARLKAESRIMRCEMENSRLRDANQSLLDSLVAAGCESAPALGVLEDEAVIESIEKSFTKFHAFLDLLKDAGLGQLTSMTGIDNSHFECFGKPQYSSTMGPNSNEEASITGGENRDVEAKTGRVGGRFVPVGLCDQTTPESQCSNGADRLHDGSLRPAAHLGIGEVEELDTKQSSGPELRVNNEGSFKMTSQNQTSFQSVSVQLESRSSNSHRSKGSHTTNFNNSYANKPASGRKETPSGSSASVSDIVSEKADSVESAGSRDGEFNRLASASRSKGKAKPERSDPDKIRSVRSLEGQSESDSF